MFIPERLAYAMIRLQPMSEAEFGTFLERAIPRRAERYARRGVWAGDQAVAASGALYARLLPNGLHTPDHHFCHLVHPTEGNRVGEVWYTAGREGGLVQFWIEWIWVEPEHRRRGFATEALRLLEQEAVRLGATRLGLDVWLDNPGAIELYRKMGYSATSMSMVKPLGPTDAATSPGPTFP